MEATNGNTKTAILTETSVNLSKELMVIEGRIRTANKAFYTIGENLNTLMNDKALYRERGIGNGTFDEYVLEIFDFTRGYAYHMVDAYCVLRVLTDHGFKGKQLPKTESQCRPMAKLVDKDIDKLVDVWTKVCDGPKITAAVIKSHVQTALGITPKITPTETNGDDVKDKTEKKGTVNPLDILGENAGNTGLDAAKGEQDNTPVVASLEAELELMKARNNHLEQELLKARQVKSGAPRSKMAIELYKAGFKALVASTTPEQMDELMALKTSLVG